RTSPSIEPRISTLSVVVIEPFISVLAEMIVGAAREATAVGSLAGVSTGRTPDMPVTALSMVIGCDTVRRTVCVVSDMDADPLKSVGDGARGAPRSTGEQRRWRKR